MGQLRQKLIELLLALVQLSTACVVDAEESHDAIDDEQAVLVTDEELGDLVQELHLVFGVDSTSVSDVVLGCPVLGNFRKERMTYQSLDQHRSVPLFV